MANLSHIRVEDRGGVGIEGSNGLPGFLFLWRRKPSGAIQILTLILIHKRIFKHGRQGLETKKSFFSLEVGWVQVMSNKDVLSSKQTNGWSAIVLMLR